MHISGEDWPTQKFSEWRGAEKKSAKRVLLHPSPPLMPFGGSGVDGDIVNPADYELFSEVNSIRHESILELRTGELFCNGRRLVLLDRERVWQTAFEFLGCWFSHTLVPSHLMYALVRFPDLTPMSWKGRSPLFVGTIYAEKRRELPPHLMGHRRLYGTRPFGNERKWYAARHDISLPLSACDGIVAFE